MSDPSLYVPKALDPNILIFEKSEYSNKRSCSLLYDYSGKPNRSDFIFVSASPQVFLKEDNGIL